MSVSPAHVGELRRILDTPEVRLRWGDEGASPQWPFDDVSATRFSVMVDGVVRGLVQYSEEVEATYRHASLDIFIDPAVHRVGIGRDALGTLARHLVRDKGHHRLVIDRQPTMRRPSGAIRQWDFAPSDCCAATSGTLTGPAGMMACSWTCWPRSWPGEGTLGLRWHSSGRYR